MKKKYSLKTIISGAMLALCLASCNPLGIEPTTMVDEDRFWLNPALARSFVNRYYTWTPAAANDRFQTDQWTDDAMTWLDGQYTNFNCMSLIRRQYDAYTEINSFKINDLWTGSYKKIRTVNLGIERIGSSTVLEVELQKQLLAESYFFRAWCYLELEQYFGTVPYLDRTLTADDETMIPRVTREQLFDNILADLTQSIQLFKESGRTPEVGMINVNAAKTFKSRVALYAACAASASEKNLYAGESASLFKFTKTPKSYYEIAFAAVGEVLDKYQLEDEYSTLFTSTSVSAKEAIWPMMFNLANRGGFNPTGWLAPLGPYYDMDVSWDVWGGIFPTQDLVDRYYQKDKADGKWKQWWKTSQAQEMGVTVDAEGNVKGASNNYRDLMYKDRDERFYATITYDGSYLCSPTEANRNRYIIQTWIDDMTTPEGKEMKYSALHTGYRYSTTDYTVNTTGRTNSYTGYYLRKYAHYDKFDSDGKLNRDQRTTCMYMLRYAEVLLNYAEAAIKLNQEGLALPRIQEIRTRAGITEEFNAATAGHSLWEEYKLQRHLEFAFEVPGQRYFDLLRWSEADGKTTIDELNRGPKAIRIHRKGVAYDAENATDITKKQVGYPLPNTDPNYVTPKVETLRYTYTEHLKKFNNARYYFFPILETIKTGYRGMTQNPGWESFNKE